jgi:hypothetical protein
MTNHAAAADRKPLNPLSIAAGFLPWIVFSLVAQRKHTPTQLNLYSLGLFGVLAVTIWFTNTYPDRATAGTTTAPSRHAAAA